MALIRSNGRAYLNIYLSISYLAQQDAVYRHSRTPCSVAVGLSK